VTLDCDLRRIRQTEFGVLIDARERQTAVLVPAGGEVEKAVHEMVRATYEAMMEDTTAPREYEPSERYSGCEHLVLPLADAMATVLRDLHNAVNLDTLVGALEDPQRIFAYFVRLTDDSGRRLTALRRATQFKGVVKSRGRLIRVINDTLTVIDDTVFKLDADFDVIADSTTLHILRPSAFESAGRLQDAVLAAVPENIEVVRDELSFADWAGIEEYSLTHPRAARCLASIRTSGRARNINRDALLQLCAEAEVGVGEANGMLSIEVGHELAFLEVLDRRRYGVRLVKDQHERYRAGNRSRLDS